MAGIKPVQLAYDVTEPSEVSGATLPPIILLHGLTGTKANWKHITSPISNGTKRKVYAVDARNHGDSEWNDDFNFDLNVDDLFYFMDTHNIPKAVLIGHSMGGITGIRAALRKPERVEKLIVEDMFVRKVPDALFEMMITHFGLLEQFVEKVPKDMDEDQAKQFILEHFTEYMFKELKIETKPDQTDMKEALLLRRKSDGSYTLNANMPVLGKAIRNRDTLLSEPEGLYDGPACFIYGEMSHLAVHQEEDHIKQFFPKAEFVCIKGASHAVHLDSRNEFIGAVLEFLLSSFSPVKLAYKVLEPVGGEDTTLAPIIFLHGLSGSKETWDGTSSSVANRTKRKTYAVDARNHGDSDWSDDFNFDMNVDDLFHFMDTHKIPKAVLIGQSMGGITGIRAALRKPEKVEKLIVEDMYVKNIPQPMLDGMIAGMVQTQECIEKLPNNLDEDQAQTMIFDLIIENMPAEMKNTMKRPPKNANVLTLKQKPDGKYTFKANIPVILKTLKNGDTLMSEPKGLYSGPACFIYGEQSPFGVKEDENHIKQFFPQAEFVCIKGASHGVSVDCPTEYRDAIVHFILEK